MEGRELQEVTVNSHQRHLKTTQAPMDVKQAWEEAQVKYDWLTFATNTHKCCLVYWCSYQMVMKSTSWNCMCKILLENLVTHNYIVLYSYRVDLLPLFIKVINWSSLFFLLCTLCSDTSVKLLWCGLVSTIVHYYAKLTMMIVTLHFKFLCNIW